MRGSEAEGTNFTSLGVDTVEPGLWGHSPNGGVARGEHGAASEQTSLTRRAQVSH